MTDGTILAIVILFALSVAPSAKGDLICPTGSLADFQTIGFELWPAYFAKNAEYVSQLLQRPSRLFKDVLDTSDLED